MEKIGKSELLGDLANKTGLPEKNCEALLKALVEIIVEKTLTDGVAVNVTGLGCFEPNIKEARTGRHPQNGTPIQIAASKTVKLKPTAALKRTF